MRRKPVKHGTPWWLRIRLSSEADANGCWIWQLYSNRGGYGVAGTAGSPMLAHRMSYEAFVGPIPAGMTVDHTCFVTLCVNPAHLRVLTVSENSLNQRQVLSPTCRRGHLWTRENEYRSQSNPRRRCLTCLRAANRRARASRKALVSA